MNKYNAQCIKGFIFFLIGIIYFLISTNVSALELPSSCQTRGGDQVCREAKKKILWSYAAENVQNEFNYYSEIKFSSSDDAFEDYKSVVWLGYPFCGFEVLNRQETANEDGSTAIRLKVKVSITVDNTCVTYLPSFLTYGSHILEGCDPGLTVSTSEDGESFCQGPRKMDNDRHKGVPEACEGNPCNVATGNKFQSEEDYAAPNAGGLQFVRSYNSTTGLWQHNYERSILHVSYFGPGAQAQVFLTREDGKVITFYEDGGKYTGPHDVNEKLESRRDESGKIIGWEFTTLANSIESYDVNGALQSIKNRNGLIQRLNYGTVDGKSVLKSVQDHFGRLLIFGTNSSGKVQTMTDPAGNVFKYDYDFAGRLSTVTYPGEKVRTYLYGETDTATGNNIGGALTGIIDENGIRYATWKYDDKGRMILSEHAGGVDHVELKYIEDSDEYRNTIVTDASGSVRTYDIALVNGLLKVTSLNAICDTCVDDAVSREYDGNGNLWYRLDRSGAETTVTYDIDRNLELDRVTRFANHIESRSTEWHPTFRLPVRITESNRETRFEYDPIYGTLLRKTVTDTNDQTSRTWTFTYDETTRLLKKADGPRKDVNDSVVYSYDSEGNISTQTDALGNITRYELYDKNGRAGSITAPDGVITRITYDGRGNIKTRKVGQELTTFDYDNVGQLISITFPSSEVITYIYDGARRLTDIKNSAGERSHFTLDQSGNRVKVENFDASGALTFSSSNEFDSYNRLHKIMQSKGQATTFETDENGTLRSLTDALGRQTVFHNDGGLLKEIVYPDQTKNSYDYDDLGNLQTVTNAADRQVSYTVNAFGEVIATNTADPDAYSIMRSYDLAGNLKSNTDFRGFVTSYTYDAIGRVKTVRATGAPSITFNYDVGTNGRGHLTSIVDESGATTRTYNSQGRVEAVSRVFSGIAIKLAYGYDTAGHLTSVTYPSGRVVKYNYDKDKIVGINVDSVSLLSQVKYSPFSRAKAWQWGNGTGYVRDRDLDGRVSAYSLGSSTRTIIYDGVGNVNEILDSADIRKNQKFSYDNLGRVTDYYAGEISAPQEHYNYDLAGNRTDVRIRGQEYAYKYLEGTDFLKNVAGPLEKTWGVDSSGTGITDGTHVFKLDGYRSVSSVTSAGTKTEYLRDGVRRRVTKRSTDGSIRHFVFDEGHRLLAELDNTGTTIIEHIWLEDQPVGAITGNLIYYVFADHLNTPRLISDTSNRVRWTWESDPFGSTLPLDDPSSLGVFSYNLRFPGQYFDAESGLHYNYFRDYDPRTGRYVQSDPIGLNGGMNAYSYASANPLSLIDFIGLQAGVAGAAGSAGAAAGAAAGYSPPNFASENTLYPAMDGDNSRGRGDPDAVRRREQTCSPHKPCPPCKTVSGRIVPVDTVGYRPLDVIPDNEVQHGVAGSHHNIFLAKQNPNNCRCFWAKQKYVLKPSEIPPGAVPIEPFVN